MMSDNPRAPSNRRTTRPGRVLSFVALLAALSALVHATGILWTGGLEAFSASGWSEPAWPFDNPVPALVLTPLFLMAFQRGYVARYRQSGLWLAWGLLLLSLCVLVPRGVFAAGWYYQPLLVLLVTCMFGAAPGLAQASLAVFGLLLAAWTTAQGPVPVLEGLPGAWTQAAIAGSVVVAMALCGALLHRTLDLAISAEADQHQRMDEAMRALRHRENLLRHALRIDTVGELSSMVVHQLRNQFQLIMGYAAVGMKGADPVASRHFQSIVDTLSQSNELLENLLGMARRESVRIQTVDLASQCEQICASYAKVLPANIELTLATPGHAVPVALDPQGLEHALLNLVINARQAINGRGEIRLRLGLEGDDATLEVEDTGCGIPADKLDEVFRPFYTTKEKGRGTGLGLAAVQRFVTSSNGVVDLRSQPGQTTFTLRFPLVAGMPRDNRDTG